MTNNDIGGDVELLRAAHLILVLNTPKGRGVFAKRDIQCGEIIEVAPVLILSPEENRDHIEKTVLYHYTYNWPLTRDDGKSMITQAVVLGLGSMFNHSSNQNIGWERNIANEVITYRALRIIPTGEELCISYGSKLTFKDSDARPPTPEGDGSQLLNQISID